MNLRNLAIWGVIVAVLITLYSVMNPTGRGGAASEISYSQLLARVDSGEVKDVALRSPVEAVNHVKVTLWVTLQGIADALAIGVP